MPVQVIIHIANEEAVVAEMEKVPTPNDTCVVALNPRARDGKDLRYLAQNVTQVVWPMNRITFVEILPSGDDEKIVSFVRE